MSDYVVLENQPPDNDDLGDIFHDLVAGVTGMNQTSVRPRWQQRPPTQPDIDEDWCAVGVIGKDPFDYPQQTVSGSVVTVHHLEQINVLASFYGPNASSYASALRTGLQLSQNLSTLSSFGIKLHSVDGTARVPELINAQFVNRVDLPMNFMRMWEATYQGTDISYVVFVQTADNPSIVNTCITPKE